MEVLRSLIVEVFSPIMKMSKICGQSSVTTSIGLSDWETDINARDDNGQTLLMCALKNNCHKNTIFKILENGGDVNIADKDKFTPLMYVLSKKNCDRDIFDKLIDLGADLNVTCKLMTPLMFALQYRPFLYEINKLLDRGAKLDSAPDHNCGGIKICRSGYTPLMGALEYNCGINIIDNFLLRGADVNFSTCSGITPLMVAICAKNDINIIKKLIISGADINARDIKGQTPILLSVKYHPKAKEVVHLLKSKGANVRDVTFNGDNILHFIRTSHLELMHQLIDYGIPRELRNHNGETPLFKAIKKRQLKKVVDLLSVGCNPNTTDNYLESPLHHLYFYRCFYVSEEVFNRLIYYGANLNAVNSSNKTPFQLLLDFYRNCIFGSFKYNVENDQEPQFIENVKTFIKTIILYQPTSLVKYMRYINRESCAYLLNYIKNFIKKCCQEIKMMKRVNISIEYTFYDFCRRKRYKCNRFLNIPVTYKNPSYYQQIFSLFPLYSNLIFIRINDNRKDKCKSNLLKSFDKLLVYPKKNCDILLTYDTLYQIGQLLDHHKLFNLFLASLL